MPQQMSLNLGEYQPQVDAALAQLEHDRVIARMWKRNYMLWAKNPQELTDRLGWLDIADTMLEYTASLQAFAKHVRDQGFTHALLLGMGGSSLAADVFRRTFGDQCDGLNLTILDSTDPQAVRSCAKSLPLKKTLFIVATKSGTTAETIAFFKYFYNKVKKVGEEQAGKHFVAITDPGSPLTQLALDYGFLPTFLNDSTIGGRYSVFSYFGLVPAALIGIDLGKLLDWSPDKATNGVIDRGALLGVIMSTLTHAGRDKLTLIASPEIASFGDWVEQLIAESTGKDGTGILPVVGEPLGPPDVYGEDRFFVHLCLDREDSQDQALLDLEQAGHPVVRMHLNTIYDLGRQFFEWELATAVAGYGLKIHPFNQPNVESSKKLAYKMIETYKTEGELPARAPAQCNAETLHAFLQKAGPSDYIALQAFVQPAQGTNAALLALRTQLRDKYRLATTVGYGPRFLHSTGQLHKGDAGNGLFVQFTSAHPSKPSIPDLTGAPESAPSFKVLINAQAQGDAEALQEVGRRIIHMDLGENVVQALEQLRVDIALIH